MNRNRISIVGLMAVAALTCLAISQPLAAQAGCPDINGIGSRVQSPLVGASFSVSGNATNYTFNSWTDTNSSGGIPGLIEYCVYPGSPPQLPTIVTPSGVQGADGKAFTAVLAADSFSFGRSGGNPSNIPLDGTLNISMGTATWTADAPLAQTILLHINDAAECDRLYGGNPGTCFVLPSPKPNPEPIALTVLKTATPSYDKTYKWTIEKDVDKTTINVASGGSATFNYTVAVTHDDGTDSNWQVNGSIVVSNPNSAPVAGVNVTDAIDNGGACTITGGAHNGVNETVSPGTTSFTYTCTYASAPSPLSGKNTATVTWPSPDPNNHPSATYDASFDFSAATPAVKGGSVDVTDSLGGTLGTVSSTDPSPKTFTYSHTFTGDPGGTCTTHPNTATFTAVGDADTTGFANKNVTVCVGLDLTVSKTATPAFKRTYKWGVTKDVDKTQINEALGGSATFNYTVNVTHDAGIDSGWTVTGNITVKNPNDWEAITADVSDAVNNGGTCTVTGGTGVLIAAGGSVSLPYTCTYASAPSPLTGINTATATWDKGTSYTPSGSASGTASFDFGATTPTIVDGSVSVTDTFGGSLGTVSYTDPSPKTFVYSHTFVGDTGGTCTNHSNTAAFETNDSKTPGSAEKTVKVCVGLDLTVSKTATPSFTRTYLWTINKAVDKTILDAGGTATYTVTATKTGFVDSNWAVTGLITVNNPNDWEAISANVTDALGNGGNCSVTGGTSVVVPTKGSVTLPYACTWSSEPNPLSDINTGTATWSSTASFTPSGSASGTAAFAFTGPTSVVNNCITVTDSIVGPLGQACDTATFTYSHKFTPPANGCTTVVNTVTIVETGQSASASVLNCNTGALTMGFWQNKNGQGIITGGASTSGFCNSGTWLRQYAPFQDLSAAATCSQVASYVYNVIKAANAAGSSMNAMLKAQMLATALDVYFSDPALGGNKIKATLPIGGIFIDLTAICSSPAAGCTNSVDSSPAFSGSCETVSAMLTDASNAATAATSTNPLADPWYLQAKAMQELAKDAFDAINNQVVVSCP